MFELNLIDIVPNEVEFHNIIIKELDNRLRDIRVREKREILKAKIANNDSTTPVGSMSMFQSPRLNINDMDRDNTPDLMTLNKDVTNLTIKPDEYITTVNPEPLKNSNTSMISQYTQTDITFSPLSKINEKYLKRLIEHDDNDKIDIKKEIKRPFTRPPQKIPNSNLSSDSENEAKSSNKEKEGTKLDSMIENLENIQFHKSKKLNVDTKLSSDSSVYLSTDDSDKNNNETPKFIKMASNNQKPPDISLEHYWEFVFNEDCSIFDSDIFEFHGLKWRLTLGKTLSTNKLSPVSKFGDPLNYALMLSLVSRLPVSPDYTVVKVACEFRLHNLLRPIYRKESKNSLVYKSNTSSYRGCVKFIGQEIYNYIGDNNKLTISVVMKSNVDTETNQLIGYDRNSELKTVDVELGSISNSTSNSSDYLTSTTESINHQNKNEIQSNYYINNKYRLLSPKNKQYNNIDNNNISYDNEVNVNYNNYEYINQLKFGLISDKKFW